MTSFSIVKVLVGKADRPPNARPADCMLNFRYLRKFWTLAAIVVLVFLRSIRKTFIIAVSIPLAIMATFVMMGAGA